MKRRIFALFAVCLAPCLPALADEGMWLFNQFPKERVKEKYGFEVTDRMLEHLRLSSVKMGASGSFVSPRGLVFTNHHVGLGCVQRVSSPQNNYVADGFLAATEPEELRCPGTEITVLQRIEDVTDKVKAAVKSPPASADANRQRKAAITAIEEACTSSTGLRCEVVTLYSGARYHLYHLKRYDDVRLVFAPEFNVGFFGGDPDNFTYPRYCLDIAFFRAYENGKPAETPNHLKWSPEGAKDGELIFVSGHPAGSSRLATVAELEFRRDHLYPEMLARLKSRIAAIHAYGAQSPENERVGRAVVFSAENQQKRYNGFLAGLRDPAVMSAKTADERKVREAVRRNPDLRRRYGKAWDEAAAAAKRYAALHKRYAVLETGAVTGSDLFFIARTLVRLAEEKPKPNEQRLREYTDAGMPSLERRLYSTAAITDSFEAAVLAEYFSYLERTLGAGDPTVKAVLGGRSPEDAARRYVSGSRLKDNAERRRLAGNASALAESKDAMIALARLLDAPARAIRKCYEDEVEAVLNTAKGNIAQARFELYGAAEYPDSTATLRLSYGVVKGYATKAGERIPWATDFAGLYRRANGKDPWRLPQRWLDAKDRLNPGAPFNFVATMDTHGGNSGSPTVNTKGEITGILFDGNLEKFSNEFVFSDVDARSVHVASQGILEALRVVYKADNLLREMGQ